MKNFLRHLFLPLTLFGYYYLVFMCLYWTTYGLIWIFTLHWLLIIIFEAILIGLVSAIATLPSLLFGFILGKLYGFSWLSVIMHSMAGVVAFVMYFVFLKNESNISINVFWEASKFKTIVLFFPYLGIVVSAFYSFVIAGVTIKYEMIKEK